MFQGLMQSVMLEIVTQNKSRKNKLIKLLVGVGLDDLRRSLATSSIL